MSLPDAIRALQEEIELWPDHHRTTLQTWLTLLCDFTTRNLRHQREGAGQA